jgi:hypothetical protein
MDLVEKNFGKYAKLELDLAGGALVGKIEVPVIGLVKEAAELVKAKIPGSIDDLVIDALIKEVEALLGK